MTPSFSIKELSRALRADVPEVDDDRMVVRLAQVSRTAPVAPGRSKFSPNLKAAIAATSVVATVLGGALVSALAFTPSEPAITPPSDNRVTDQVDPRPGTDRATPRRESLDRSVPGPHRAHPTPSSPATHSAPEPLQDPTEPVVPSQPAAPTTSSDPDLGNQGPKNEPGTDHESGTSSDSGVESETRGDEVDDRSGDSRTGDDAADAEPEETD